MTLRHGARLDTAAERKGWTPQSMAPTSLPRRKALLHMAAACAAVCVGVPSGAARFPSRTVRVLVGAAPGGPTDFMARLFGDTVGAALGQTFIVENRAGANGTLAAEAAARAKPDGYTLLVAGPSSAVVAPQIFPSVGFDTESFIPIAMLGAGALVLAVHPSVPAHDVRGLIALMRAKPGSLTFGSGGIGSSGHLCGELFAQLAGGRMLHVPYKGDGIAVNDVVGGHIQLIFTAPNVAVPYVKSGKLRVLAVTTRERLPSMPDVPTVSESDIGDFEYVGWIMAFAPLGTPQPAVKLLADAWGHARVQGVIKRRLDDLSMSAPDRPANAEALSAFLRAERTRLSKVIRDANIKAD